MKKLFPMRKLLITFAVIVFLISLVLAIYYGVTGAKENYIETSTWGSTSVKERFNFGLFLIGFLKWIAFGLFGGGVLLSLANREER
jgi:TRAP-type C4-dicarboxylate transport system permease small subunit